MGKPFPARTEKGEARLPEERCHEEEKAQGGGKSENFPRGGPPFSSVAGEHHAKSGEDRHGPRVHEDLNGGHKLRSEEEVEGSQPEEGPHGGKHRVKGLPQGEKKEHAAQGEEGEEEEERVAPHHRRLVSFRTWARLCGFSASQTMSLCRSSRRYAACSTVAAIVIASVGQTSVHKSQKMQIS